MKTDLVKYIIALLLPAFLYSCISYDRKQEVFMSDKDFVEFDRKYSPDSSMILLNYGIDLGAFGYGRAVMAILRLDDTVKNLRLFTLPNKFHSCNWIDNKTVSAIFDTIPFVRSGERPNYQDTKVNGVKVKMYSYDYIEPNSERKIELRETSPNGRYELVAYRYNNDNHNLGFIHVSVIPVGEQIPKYGNYLIADRQADYVLNGKWDQENSIIFYSNDLYSELVQYYLVHNHPDIQYQVINDNKTYGSKYLWTGQSSR